MTTAIKQDIKEFWPPAMTAQELDAFVKKYIKSSHDVLRTSRNYGPHYESRNDMPIRDEEFGTY